MRRSVSNNEGRMEDEEKQQQEPLTITECWSLAYEITRKHYRLFVKVGASAVIPVALVVLVCQPTDVSKFWWLSILSIAVANGPVMVATANLLEDGMLRPSSNNEAMNHFDWQKCYSIFYGRWKIVARLLLGELLANAWVILRLILTMIYPEMDDRGLLLLPELYFTVRFYFLPCILLFESQSNIRKAAKTSFVATSSSPPTPSNTLMFDRRKGMFGIKLEILCVLCRLFALELVPVVVMSVVGYLPVLLLTVTGILSYENQFTSFLYWLAIILNKCWLVPFGIVLKTILYFNICIMNNNGDCRDLRSLLGGGLELWLFERNGDNTEHTFLLGSDSAA